MLTAETASMCNMCFKEKICGHKAGIVGCDQFAKKIKTNADRIRAMSDKELFDFICMITGNVRCGLSPAYGWDSWLKQEAT